jgi:hypothetical protein
MTGTVHTIAAEPSTRQLAGQPANRPVESIMRAVKARFAHKPAQHLAEILGCDISTAERYFAGARSPSFDNTVTMLRHPVTSVAMLEEATRNLPPEEFQKFWKAMAAAALAAWTRDNNETNR